VSELPATGDRPRRTCVVSAIGSGESLGKAHAFRVSTKPMGSSPLIERCRMCRRTIGAWNAFNACKGLAACIGRRGGPVIADAHDRRRRKREGWALFEAEAAYADSIFHSAIVARDTERCCTPAAVVCVIHAQHR